MKIHLSEGSRILYNGYTLFPITNKRGMRLGNVVETNDGVYTLEILATKDGPIEFYSFSSFEEAKNAAIAYFF